MSRWKLFFWEVIGMFVFMASLALLSDYWTIGETAFDELLTPEFYAGKIVFSVFFGISTQISIWRGWIKLGNT